MAVSVSSLVINGWSIFVHPVFLDQMEKLIEEVEARKIKDPDNYRFANCTKRLAAIVKLVTKDIPPDDFDTLLQEAVSAKDLFNKAPQPK